METVREDNGAIVINCDLGMETQGQQPGDDPDLQETQAYLPGHPGYDEGGPATEGEDDDADDAAEADDSVVEQTMI